MEDPLDTHLIDAEGALVTETETPELDYRADKNSYGKVTHFLTLLCGDTPLFFPEEVEEFNQKIGTGANTQEKRALGLFVNDVECSDEDRLWMQRCTKKLFRMPLGDETKSGIRHISDSSPYSHLTSRRF